MAWSRHTASLPLPIVSGGLGAGTRHQGPAVPPNAESLGGWHIPAGAWSQVRGPGQEVRPPELGDATLAEQTDAHGGSGVGGLLDMHSLLQLCAWGVRDTGQDVGYLLGLEPAMDVHAVRERRPGSGVGSGGGIGSTRTVVIRRGDRNRHSWLALLWR